jgi:hypothetical protein
VFDGQIANGYATITRSAARRDQQTGQGVAQKRNTFEWHSRSLGAEWMRTFAWSRLRVLGWGSTADAGSDWAAELAPVRMSSERRDQGLAIVLDRGSTRANTVVGLRLERSNTSYQLASDSAALSWDVTASTPVGTAFADFARPIRGRTAIRIGASLAATGGTLYPAPRVTLRYAASDRLTLTGSVTRSHQFVQSFRNAESVVNVFPAELYMGAGAGRPVA